MVFRKGREKTGGRKRGTSNNVTIELKALIDRMLPADELEQLWKEKLYSKDEWVAMKALELALMYRHGKPKTADEDSSDAPLIIDISAMPPPKLPAST